MRRVVVTGLGGIASLGSSAPSIWFAVARGACGIDTIASIPTGRLHGRIAAEIRGFNPAHHFNTKQLPMLDRVSQLALVAGREAVQQAAPAGLAALGLAPQRCAVVLGAGTGQQTLDDAYRQLYGEDAARLHPFTLARSMQSAAASQLAIAFGLRGPCFAIASACASATHALGIGFQMIRAGMCDLVLSGGSDASICLGYLKAWDALHVLSAEACRPFSKDRSGLVIGEGAAVLVLEEMEQARRRGAPMLGEIVGFGMSADAQDMVAPSVDGATRAMQAALDDARLPSSAVDYVNAHGTGTRLNDAMEAAALRRVFGARLAHLPVSSTKSMLGHCLTAGGALEALVTILALRDGLLPPTIGFREADPDCALDVVPHHARKAPVEVALSNSFAFGGLNAALLLRRAP
jgi:nodulation protein E